MKAALVTGPGKAPVFADFQEPHAKPGEVLIEISAAAISHVTKGRASGRHYSSSGRYPFVAGIDGVGRAEDGSRVYFVLPDAPFGGMAERVAIGAERCVPVPDGLDDVTAAALANPGMSSWAAYAERAKLRAGETVLVNGATGTSGRLAVRIAKHLGAGKVIATGRNAEALATLDADATVQLTGDDEEAFKPHVADGVDVVIDYLWGKSAQSLLIAAAKAAPEARRLRFVQVGSLSGGDISLPSAVLRSSAIELMGSGIGSVPAGRLIACIGDLLQAAPSAGLEIAVTPRPLSQVEAAWGEDDSRRRTVFLTGSRDCPRTSAA